MHVTFQFMSPSLALVIAVTKLLWEVISVCQQLGDKSLSSSTSDFMG